MARFVIIHENTKAGEAPTVCEADEGICYDHYETVEAAQASCDKMNAQSKANGWGSVYWPAIGHPDMTYA